VSRCRRDPEQVGVNKILKMYAALSSHEKILCFELSTISDFSHTTPTSWIVVRSKMIEKA